MVDEPPENQDVERENEERLQKYGALMQEWVDYKNGNGMCPKNKDGKAYTWTPLSPKRLILLRQ